MATIRRSALNRLTNQINACSKEAVNKVLNAVDQLNWNDVAACRDATIEVTSAVIDTYGLAAAQAAADFYDVARQVSIGEATDATAYTGLNHNATSGAIRAFVTEINSGNYSGFRRLLSERIDYELKCAAANCVSHNGYRDSFKPRFARVPSGTETCRFCIMLASRGAVYKSSDSAGATGHFHANCDCRIVPIWDAVQLGVSRATSGTIIEGYDPDELYSRYCEFASDPEFRKRISQSSAYRGITHAHRWAVSIKNGDVTMHSLADIARYLNSAEDYDELFRRIELIKREFPYYGIDIKSKDYKYIVEQMAKARRNLLGAKQMQVIEEHKDK